jgi:hypothetical protein
LHRIWFVPLKAWPHLTNSDDHLFVEQDRIVLNVRQRGRLTAVIGLPPMSDRTSTAVEREGTLDAEGALRRRGCGRPCLWCGALTRSRICATRPRMYTIPSSSGGSPKMAPAALLEEQARAQLTQCLGPTGVGDLRALLERAPGLATVEGQSKLRIVCQSALGPAMSVVWSCSFEMSDRHAARMERPGPP